MFTMVLNLKKCLQWLWIWRHFCNGCESEEFVTMAVNLKNVLQWLWISRNFCNGCEFEEKKFKTIFVNFEKYLQYTRTYLCQASCHASLPPCQTYSTTMPDIPHLRTLEAVALPPTLCLTSYPHLHALQATPISMPYKPPPSPCLTSYPHPLL